VTARAAPVAAWTVRAVVNAALEALTGREAIAAQQITATFDRAFVIRFRADVSVTDRIVWAGRTLQIDRGRPGRRRIGFCG
jgi:SPP1 family predicted phage head-tail adaptor